MESRFASLAIFIAMIALTWSYPTTVPPTPAVCSKMTPGHGPSPQKSEAPYQVTVSSNSVKGGNNVQVTLAGIGGSEFKGFYVQARDNNESPIGVFVKGDGIKTHGCGGIKNNGAHHSGKDLKESITVFWQAPKDYEGEVTFTATFVQEFETFWTQVRSTPVSVSNDLIPVLTTDSREEGETTKATQESRVLNYNPYSPTLLRNEDFASKDVSPFSRYDASPSYSTAQVPVQVPQVQDPSATTRIRKSYFIPKPKQAYEHDAIAIHDHNLDCNSNPHHHVHHHLTSVYEGNVNRPQEQNLPSYYNPKVFKQIPSTKIQSHGAGYLNLDRPSPTPPLSQQLRFTERPLLYQGNIFPGFRPTFNPSEYNSYNLNTPIRHGPRPVFSSFPNVGTNFKITSGLKPDVPVYGNYVRDSSRIHGILVGDYPPTTGIVLPKDMQSYQIPRYGYLVFNPKRGPPYYIIPVEDSASFEEAHNLGETHQGLPQPALSQFRSRSGGISFESGNPVYKKSKL